MFRQQIRDAREEGFTLIELLIVIVVLGILAGIVVFGVSQFRQDAETAACKADLKIVQVASDAFTAKSTTGAFATTVDQLVAAKYIKTAPAAVAQAMTGGVAVKSSTAPADC